MPIEDILLRDPSQEALVNNGQARITNEAADADASDAVFKALVE